MSVQEASSLDRNGVRVDPVVDTIFGVPVPDPYRHLERGQDPSTIAWSAKQNAAARTVLDALPSHSELHRRLDQLHTGGNLSAPIVRGGRSFFTSQRGTQEQAVLHVREGEVDRVLIDPATLDSSGLFSLNLWHPSSRGNLVACELTNSPPGGSISVFDVRSGNRLADEIPNAWLSSLAWLPDESGFYYTRLPPDSTSDQRVYRHLLGRPWSEDELIFGEGRSPKDRFGVLLSQNGRWLLVSAVRGFLYHDLYLQDLHSSDRRFLTLVEGRDALFQALFRGDDLLIRSNDEASRYALFIAEAANPSRNRWRVLVPESEDVFDAFTVTQDHVVLSYLHDAHARLSLLDPQGTLSDVKLPPLGNVTDLSAQELSDDAFAVYTSFTQAPTAYRIDVTTGSLEVWDALDPVFDASRYHAEQVWFTSADGTRVPMYVLAHTATPKNGTAPAVLTAYAAWGHSYLPEYSPSIVPWLDAGGIYVIANLRGGGEFGDAWRLAGNRHNRQNTVDDLIAAAKFLGSSGYANSAKIGILGESAGGTLVCAAMTQRPELFRSVVAQVPVCDMIRYPYFLLGHLWTKQTGDPEDSEDFPFLLAYSPYHQVREGTAYPATLFFTSDGDMNVDPMHTRKMAARMQAATAGKQPILVHIEKDLPHSMGRPRGKQVEELTNIWNFFAWQLGIRW